MGLTLEDLTQDNVQRTGTWHGDPDTELTVRIIPLDCTDTYQIRVSVSVEALDSCYHTMGTDGSKSIDVYLKDPIEMRDLDTERNYVDFRATSDFSHINIYKK